MCVFFLGGGDGGHFFVIHNIIFTKIICIYMPHRLNFFLALFMKFNFLVFQKTEKLRKKYLNVGSWSFEGIIILLIYFLNCRKALFTKK